MTDFKKDIWDKAIELSNIDLNDDRPDGNSSIVFVGSKQGGKSSVIYRFIEKSDSIKPTVALEYMFARKSKANESGKNVCNIWELGGGLLFTNLVEFVITHKNLSSNALVLVIDLSTPEELIITTETLITAIQERIENLLKNTNKSIETLLRDKAVDRIGKNHEDFNKLNPFLIPLLILGTKYDIFQNFESEKKNLIVKYLRLICHSFGAQLLFVSTKSEALMNKSRVAVNNLWLETPVERLAYITDHTKPIYIPFGSDSFERIGMESIETLKRMYVSMFPQMVTQLVIPDDPAKDVNFKERDIDLMRAQKDSDLEEYKRQMEVKLQSKRVKI